MSNPQRAARGFHEAGRFGISALHPLATLEFDLASQNGLLSCVVPEIESWKVFHFDLVSIWFFVSSRCASFTEKRLAQSSRITKKKVKK
jgi:hypothetical protein